MLARPGICDDGGRGLNWFLLLLLRRGGAAGSIGGWLGLRVGRLGWRGSCRLTERRRFLGRESGCREAWELGSHGMMLECFFFGDALGVCRSLYPM